MSKHQIRITSNKVTYVRAVRVIDKINGLWLWEVPVSKMLNPGDTIAIDYDEATQKAELQ